MKVATPNLAEEELDCTCLFFQNVGCGKSEKRRVRVEKEPGSPAESTHITTATTTSTLQYRYYPEFLLFNPSNTSPASLIPRVPRLGWRSFSVLRSPLYRTTTSKSLHPKHDRHWSRATHSKAQQGKAQTSATKPGSSSASRSKSAATLDSDSARRRTSRGGEIARSVGVLPVTERETSDATVVSAMTT